VGVLERFGSLAVGGVALAYGLSRRSLTGVGIAAAGSTLLYRGATGRCPVYSTMGWSSSAADTHEALSGSKGVLVNESVRLERSVAEVYRFWRQFENLPRFMKHLESVTPLEQGRTRWVASGPLGVHVTWDAEIINENENVVIGWRSLPGGDISTAGSVNFDRIPDSDATRVTVRLQYAAPGGNAGAWIATVFGKEPSQTIREDLRRLKQLLEAGEIATGDRAPQTPANSFRDPALASGPGR
jgi:uncharacterized membrane protein